MALLGQGWTMMAIDSEYVPKIGEYVDAETGRRNEAKPRTSNSAGEVLASKAPCGAGKSTVFRQFMRKIFDENSHARVLLLSANILYGTNLAHELQQNDFTSVGFYREGTDLTNCQVVVCSLESLHRLGGQRFDAMLIDECRTIARLVGGATMHDFSNLYLLGELCASTMHVVVCDADLDFKVHSSEPTPLVYDFLKQIAPERNVLCTYQTRAPSHLQRSARLFYDYSEKDPNEQGKKKKVRLQQKRWFQEMEQAAQAWHQTKDTDNPQRFAVCVGSIPQLDEVVDRLRAWQVPYKPYSSKTGDAAKFENLKNPGEAWAGYGCIVSTTTLSIGVDPKGINFARVFIWTSRTGCTLLQQLQAAMRFGREAARPLTDRCICILVDCMAPGVRARLVHEKKMSPLKPPTYDDVLKRLQLQKGATARRYEQENRLAGGHPKGASVVKFAADSILRVMAHGRLERRLQAADHDSVLKCCLKHYGWRIEPDADEAIHTPLDASELDQWAPDEDDLFAHGKAFTNAKRYEVILQQILRDENGFFENCYGLVQAKGKAATNLTAKEKFLVGTYWLLKPLGCVPWCEAGEDEDGEGDEGGEGGEGGEDGEDGEGGSEGAAEEDGKGNGDGARGGSWVAKTAKLLVQMEWARDGLELNALAHCMSFEEAMRYDATRRHEPGSKMANPQLKSAPGSKMACIDEFARLIGVENLYADFELDESNRIVQIARRQALKMDEYGDLTLLMTLRCKAEELKLGGKATIPQLLCSFADVCGMRVVRGLGGRLGTYERPRQPDGSQPYLLKHMRVCRVLPEIVAQWRVWSRHLGRKVRVEDWREAHDSLEEEEVQAAYEDELDPDDFDTSPPVTAERREEKLDGVALSATLGRLHTKNADARRPAAASGVGTQRPIWTKADARWLKWLERADSEALPRHHDGEDPPPVRKLIVSYHKRRVIGRRTASYPSMQNCPSGLRPLLVKRWYHDVDMVNCHPVLMLQVALFMKVQPYDLETLEEYVQGAVDTDGKNGRERILHRIMNYHGVERKWAKEAVLRMLNGGSIQKWMADAKCTRGRHAPQPDLESLQAEAHRVHDAFFAMDRFRPHAETLTNELRVSTQAALEKAKRAVQAASTTGAKAAAQKQFENARAKATSTAIRRSVFSHCIFELEDMVLTVIDEHFQAQGLTVSSLQYDGLHVEHRRRETAHAALAQHHAVALSQLNGRPHRHTLPAAVDLKPVMERASAEVKQKLGYVIQLDEKELFHHHDMTAEEQHDADDVEMANADSEDDE